MIAALHPAFQDIARDDWDRCLPAESESHAYYQACTGRHPVHPVAVSISDKGRVIAVAPVISLAYRLDTSLQGGLRRITDWLSQWWKGLFKLELIGLGSPLAERCHIGFDPSLSLSDKQAAFALMLEAIDTYARGHGIGLITIKDISEDNRAELAPVLAHKKLHAVNSLPIAVLDVPDSTEAYLASLSPATRKDIRRKLKSASALSIEMVHDLSGLAPEIDALYEETRSQSRYDYDEMEALPQGYFAAVSEALGETAPFMLYRLDGQLIGFNLLLVERGRLIDKFIGMRYPLGPEHNLYAISWMANLDFCIRNGIGLLQTGQTAYAAKLRMGSRLVPSFIYFRHNHPLLNMLLSWAAPFLAFDRQDPDLQKLHQNKGN